MSTLIEYPLEDGATILILDTQAESGVVKAGRGETNVTVQSKKKFEEVLKDIRSQSQALLREINALEVSEAEIKFGLSVSTELGGSMFIGKIGGGVNYEITLKWSKKPTTK